MAQIDPSIALGVKPIQIEDPINRFARQQELSVNMMKANEMQRGVEVQNKLRQAFAEGVDPSTPEGFKRFAAIDAPTALKLKTDALQGQKLQGDVKKTGLEINEKTLKAHRERMSDLALNPSPENTAAHIQDAIIRGDITPEQGDRTLKQTLAMSPEQRKQYFLQLGADAAKRIEQLTLSEAQRQNLNVQREGQNKPVFSADYGGFVTPPSARNPQGVFTPITDPTTGAPLQSNKPLTEGQAKGVGFALRAKEADQILNKVGKKGDVQPGTIKRVLESTPFIGEGLGTTFNWTQSEEQQQVEQAQRNFVNAVLRQESGAVINEDEFNNAKKQYFPQPGDSNAVIEQKEKARKTTIKALETQAGPGLKRAGGGKAEDPLGIR